MAPGMQIIYEAFIDEEGEIQAGKTDLISNPIDH
jgi:hypothetical protein